MPRFSEHRCQMCGDYLPADDLDAFERGETPSTLCPPCSKPIVKKVASKHARSEGREPKQRVVRPDQVTKQVRQARKLLEEMNEEPLCQRRVPFKKRGVKATKKKCGRLESEHPVGRCPAFLGISPREERARLKEQRKEEREQKRKARELRKALKEHRRKVAESLERRRQREEEDKEALKRGWQGAGFHAAATRKIKVGESKSGRALYRTKGKFLCGARVRKDVVLVRGSEPTCKGCVVVVKQLNERAEARKEKAMAKSKSKKQSKKSPAKKGAKKAAPKRTGAKDWFRQFMRAKPQGVKRASLFEAAVKKFGEACLASMRSWVSSAKKDKKVLGVTLKESAEGVLKPTGKFPPKAVKKAD